MYSSKSVWTGTKFACILTGLVLLTVAGLPGVFAAPPTQTASHPTAPMSRGNTATKRTAIPANQDSDGDGLSDWAELHKYFTDPHRKDSVGQGRSDRDPRQRKEYTYTITSVVQILKPYRVADMTDDYQDARLLHEDKDSATVEITYYPFNTNAQAISENPHWQRDDAGMTDYLRPTPTENWDAAMRADLLRELRQSDIDPDELTDRQLVEKVSRWAMERSQSVSQFNVWYVTYPNGVPTVAPALRADFDALKHNPNWTDQQAMDYVTLGRGMFYGKTHGDCTSSSVYLTTIFRALGLPTRIVICIPPADGNDPAQVQALQSGIHHIQARWTIGQGLRDARGFANHLFNEVYIAHHWVRLNYTRLGQNILDPSYFGLLTHIYTARSLSDIPLAQTWGIRYAHHGSDGQPLLSSVNPYRLLSISDHWGRYSRVGNPPLTAAQKAKDDAERAELKAVTIAGVFSRDDPRVAGEVRQSTSDADFFLGIHEWIDGQDYHQLRKFYARASHDFLLRSPGHPDIYATINGNNYDALAKGPTGNRIAGYAAQIVAEDKSKVVHGIAYTLIAVNTSAVYRWSNPDSLTLTFP